MTGCYILFSALLNKFYVGATQADVHERIAKHNERFYGRQRFTATASDWTLYLFISTVDYAQAIRIERKIKSMKSSVYIRNLKQYPDIVAQLVSST